MNILTEFGMMIHREFSSNNFFSGAVMGGALLGAFHYLRGYPKKIYTWFLARFCVIVYFDSTDDVYAYIQMWLHHEVVFDRYKKHYRIISQKKHPAHLEDSAVPHVGGGSEDSEDNNLEFLFTPFTGNYIFKYHNKWLKIEFERQDKSGAGEHDMSFGKPLDKLTIKYLGRDIQYAKEFLEEISKIYKTRTIKDVRVYMPESNSRYWAEHSKLLYRPKESLILKDSDIDRLINDVALFIKKDTEQWYIKMGIPYHRGYMFYGPPGTGKSSTAYILASYFHKDIYFMSISKSVTDNDFLALLNSVEHRCFLVIEDIDCIFDENRTTKSDKSLSFNTVLNALDGFCSKHGNIVIITTNHPEKLDKALIRPGRIDMKVFFDYFNQEQAERLFLKFFPDEEGLAIKFSKSLETNKYSGAQIQEFLMRYRDDPRAALTNIVQIDTVLAETTAQTT